MNGQDIGRIGEVVVRAALESLGIRVRPTPASGSRGPLAGDLVDDRGRVFEIKTTSGPLRSALRASQRAARRRWHVEPVACRLIPDGDGLVAEVHVASHHRDGCGIADEIRVLVSAGEDILRIRLQIGSCAHGLRCKPRRR